MSLLPRFIRWPERSHRLVTGANRRDPDGPPVEFGALRIYPGKGYAEVVPERERKRRGRGD